MISVTNSTRWDIMRAMDVERTMEFILEQQAKAEVRMAKWEERQERVEARMDKWEERQAKTDKQLAAIRTILKAGMKMMVRLEEGQRQNQAAIKELAASHKELAAAQADTQKTLKAFIDSMRRGGNGRR